MVTTKVTGESAPHLNAVPHGQYQICFRRGQHTQDLMILSLKGLYLREGHSFGFFKIPSHIWVSGISESISTLPLCLHHSASPSPWFPLKWLCQNSHFRKPPASQLPPGHDWEIICLSSRIKKFCRFCYCPPDAICLFSRLLTGWGCQAGHFQRHHQEKQQTGISLPYWEDKRGSDK